MRWIVFIVFITNLFAVESIELIHYDPFKQAKKIIISQKKQQPIVMDKPKPLRISAIFNDKVFINGKFYRVSDRIYSYKIVKIGKNKVVMRKKDKVVVLYFMKKNHFQMKEK